MECRKQILSLSISYVEIAYPSKIMQIKRELLDWDRANIMVVDSKAIVLGSKTQNGGIDSSGIKLTYKT